MEVRGRFVRLMNRQPLLMTLLMWSIAFLVLTLLSGASLAAYWLAAEVPM